MAVLTLSHRANSDHTADDFAVGQRVKAHPATDTLMRGDVYGTIDFISRGPKRLVLVKMDRRAEKVSGAVTDRKALARAIAALGPVDVSLGHKA